MSGILGPNLYENSSSGQCKNEDCGGHHNVIFQDMAKTKRAMIYFEESLLEALQLKAAATDTSISNLVNSAVRRFVAEDTDDLAAFRRRAKEPRLYFDDVVDDVKVGGNL